MNIGAKSGSLPAGMLDEIRASIAYVTIRTDSAGGQVAVDGQALEPERFGRPFALDPGRHLGPSDKDQRAFRPARSGGEIVSAAVLGGGDDSG